MDFLIAVVNAYMIREKVHGARGVQESSDVPAFGLFDH